jgi:hypothetical protein
LSCTFDDQCDRDAFAEVGRRRTRGASVLGRRALVTFLLGVAPLAVFAGVWRLGGVSAIGDDLIYYLPVRTYIGQSLRAGELPLWDRFVALGTSIAADPQSGLFYPATWLFAVLPPLVAYPVTLGLHFALAGAGMYRFLRASRHDWRGALLGALAFEYGGYLIAHRSHLTILESSAWLPWAFYFWRRFADSGRYRHFAFGTLALGLQWLVQHTQPSIMTHALLVSYAAVILWPRRRALWWQLPIGIALGGVIGAVQILPTYAQFAGSIRGTPAYYLFVENSWVLSSAMMLLFPMLFGASTPNEIWPIPWWGISHFVEQWAYASIGVLLLAAASSALLRRLPHGLSRGGANSAAGESRMSEGADAEGDSNTGEAGAQRSSQTGSAPDPLACARASSGTPAVPSPLASRPSPLSLAPRREVIFWWAACGVALLLALGSASPLSKLLFHVPIYRSLRVPARWILVWSVAMPVLASMVVTVLMRASARANCGQAECTGGNAHAERGPAERVAARLRWLCTRGLPIAVGASVVVMLVAWLLADRLNALLPPHWSQPVWSGLKQGLRPTNPAIWGPLVLMAIMCWLLVRWTRRPSAGRLAAIIAVVAVDLWSIAATVDVDSRYYTRADLTATPPLATAIKSLTPRPGDRLLVPRFYSSYNRPLEVLWPLSNLPYGIPTANGYGPLWSAGNRLLLRFMAWGSSEEILPLLRNPALMRALGVRFLAVRSPEERELLRLATAPSVPEAKIEPVAGTEAIEDVPWQAGLRWEVRVDAPGIYQLEFDAEPVVGSSSRWFLRLEAGLYEEIGKTHCVDPVDLSVGPRRMRFLLPADRAVGQAWIRVKSEAGIALRAGRATFGRIAEYPKVPANIMELPAEAGPFVHRAEVEGGISLYELPGAPELLCMPADVQRVPTLTAALDELLRPTSGTEAGRYRLGADPAVRPIVEDMQADASHTGEPPVPHEGHAGETPVPHPPVAHTLGGTDKSVFVGASLARTGEPVPHTSQRRVDWRRPHDWELVAEVDGAAAGMLVFNEAYDLGWRATVDGSPVSIHRVNAVFQGVEVPAGRHEVRFRYLPPGLKLGALLSCVALGLLGAGRFIIASKPA